MTIREFLKTFNVSTTFGDNDRFDAPVFEFYKLKHYCEVSLAAAIEYLKTGKAPQEFSEIEGKECCWHDKYDKSLIENVLDSTLKGLEFRKPKDAYSYSNTDLVIVIIPPKFTVEQIDNIINIGYETKLKIDEAQQKFMLNPTRETCADSFDVIDNLKKKYLEQTGITYDKYLEDYARDTRSGIESLIKKYIWSFTRG